MLSGLWKPLESLGHTTFLNNIITEDEEEYEDEYEITRRSSSYSWSSSSSSSIFDALWLSALFYCLLACLSVEKNSTLLLFEYA